MSETDFNKLFAKNLTHQLSINNKSQKDLAQFMEVSEATISNWCNGIKLPRMDKVDNICTYFNIHSSDLMVEKIQVDEPNYYLDKDAHDMAQLRHIRY